LESLSQFHAVAQMVTARKSDYGGFCSRHSSKTTIGKANGLLHSPCVSVEILRCTPKTSIHRHRQQVCCCLILWNFIQ